MVPVPGGQLRDEYSHYRHCIIIKDCRDIFRGEFVGGVRDEQARLSHCTVTNNNTPVYFVSIRATERSVKS